MVSRFLDLFPLSEEEEVLSLLQNLDDNRLGEAAVRSELLRQMPPDRVEAAMQSPFLRHFIDRNWDSVSAEKTMFGRGGNVMAFSQLRFSSTPLHSHRYFELVYTAHGACRNTFADHALSMEAGDLCVIPPGCVHQLGGIGAESLVYNILVRTSTFRETFTDLLTAEDTLSAFFLHSICGQEPGMPLLFRSGRNPAIRETVQSLAGRRSDPGQYAGRISDNYFRLLISLVLETCQNLSGVEQVCSVKKLSALAILRYLERNYRTASLKEAAAELGYSENYLSKLMKRDTGTSFRRQLSDIRMSRAAALLGGSELPVQEIMERVGITDLSYFYRAFRRYAGLTPAEFRKQA